GGATDPRRNRAGSPPAPARRAEVSLSTWLLTLLRLRRRRWPRSPPPARPQRVLRLERYSGSAASTRRPTPCPPTTRLPEVPPRARPRDVSTVCAAVRGPGAAAIPPFPGDSRARGPPRGCFFLRGNRARTADGTSPVVG